MTTTRWLDEREQRAWRAYSQLHRRLTKVLGQQLTRDSGLSTADYELLVPLSEAADGQLRARDLARTVDWEKSRLSHHLTRMEQRGLVGRVGCPTDARGAFLVLTDAGRRAIEDAAPQHVETVREHFIDLLSDAEIAVVTAMSERLLARLETTNPKASACGDDDEVLLGL